MSGIICYICILWFLILWNVHGRGSREWPTGWLCCLLSFKLGQHRITHKITWDLVVYCYICLTSTTTHNITWSVKLLRLYRMDSVTKIYLSQHLPSQELTDFDIGINFQSARERITELMDQHGLVEFLKSNYLSELFDPQDLVLCSYYDESEFVKKTIGTLKITWMSFRWISVAYQNIMVSCYVCYMC